MIRKLKIIVLERSKYNNTDKANNIVIKDIIKYKTKYIMRK